MGRDGVRVRRAIDQGVAVGGAARGGQAAYGADGAGPIVDHDGLAQPLRDIGQVVNAAPPALFQTGGALVFSLLAAAVYLFGLWAFTKLKKGFADVL